MIVRPVRPDEARLLSVLAREAKASWGYPAAWLRAWEGELTFTAGASLPTAGAHAFQSRESPGLRRSGVLLGLVPWLIPPERRIARFSVAITCGILGLEMAWSGRLAEQMGDDERAIREYRCYVKVRRYSGPELVGKLEEVQAALARLEGR